MTTEFFDSHLIEVVPGLGPKGLEALKLFADDTPEHPKTNEQFIAAILPRLNEAWALGSGWGPIVTDMAIDTCSNPSDPSELKRRRIQMSKAFTAIFTTAHHKYGLEDRRPESLLNIALRKSQQGE